MRTFCLTATRMPSSSSTVMRSAACITPGHGVQGEHARQRRAADEIGARGASGSTQCGKPFAAHAGHAAARCCWAAAAGRRCAAAALLPRRSLTSVGRLQRALHQLAILPPAGVDAVRTRGGVGGRGKQGAGGPRCAAGGMQRTAERSCARGVRHAGGGRRSAIGARVSPLDVQQHGAPVRLRLARLKTEAWSRRWAA